MRTIRAPENAPGPTRARCGRLIQKRGHLKASREKIGLHCGHHFEPEGHTMHKQQKKTGAGKRSRNKIESQPLPQVTQRGSHTINPPIRRVRWPPGRPSSHRKLIQTTHFLTQISHTCYFRLQLMKTTSHHSSSPITSRP